MRNKVETFGVGLGRHGLWILLALLMLLLPTAHARGQALPARWVLTFDDEFHGHALDTKKWTAGHGPSGIREDPVQFYTPDDVIVGHGGLTIRSEQRTMGGCAYTSGDISSLNKFAQRYGRFEARCRFPRLPGTWSAFYLLPASGAWPPEIDVTEFIGRDPQHIYLTNHWQGSFGHQQENRDRWDATADWTQWHVYRVDWEPGRLQWFIDGLLQGVVTNGVSDVPMYLRLNTAIGGVFAGEPSPGGWPQDFGVDYVRVYRRADLPAPILGVTALPPALPPDLAPLPPTVYEDGGSPWTPDDGWLLLGLILGWVLTARAPAGQSRTTRALAVAVGLSAAWYLTWRVGVIAWDAWPLGLPLFAAEAFGILQTLGFQYTVWPRPEPVVLCREDPTWRPVFILIPTVNEGRIVVEPTVRGALAARARYLEAFPHASVTVALCNDGRVADYSFWPEMEALAADHGVLCLTRLVGGGAKAGNLEHARQALGATGEALVVLFDADMAAEPDFLLETIPPFGDPSIGWVQTGQYYRNLDNPMVRWAHDQQMVFFGALCPGKARLQACFICGTNVVIRAAALDEIGGLPQDSLTEDFAASLLLHARWRSLFLPQVLATGLGPVDLPAYFGQQRRWAMGTLDALRRHGRRVFRAEPGGLQPAQRVQYGLSGTHYLSGLCHALFFLAPLLYLLFGVPALRPIGVPDFCRHFVPFLAASNLAFWYACGRRLRWRGVVLGFGSFPILVASLWAVLRGHRGRFVVTAKRRLRRAGAWRSLRPHGIALLAGLSALAAAPGSSGGTGLLPLSALWVLYSMGMLAVLFRLAVTEGPEEAPEPLPPSDSQVSVLAASVVQRRREKMAPRPPILGE